MLARRKYIIQAFIIILTLGFMGGFALSDDNIISVPNVPKAEGGECVAPPEVMRKNHMKFLKHDRDLRVQKGGTNIDYSLKKCIGCHVVRDDAGSPVSYDNPAHFCRSCHQYVAVKIDCFSCHNSKPDQNITLSLTPSNTHKFMLSNLPQSWQGGDANE